MSKTLFLVLISLLFYQSSINDSFVKSPERSIANDNSKIYRNRVIEPERTVEAVHIDSKTEKVVRLKEARIVIADYELIRRDFPHIKDLSNPEIDDWILNQVAFVSIPQSEQTVVNTRIPVTDTYRDAARPPDYGRALVFPMIDPKDNKTAIGLIDVKGSGALNPGQKDHGNGVATLGECVREFLYENLMRDVLDDANLPNKTVASYAVIDAGFGVIHKDGSSSPAGLYLRQAHHRTRNPGAWLNADVRSHLQSIFHQYGIDPNTNIQGTENDDIFDFGHYVVKDDLKTTIHEKQIPFSVWGYDKSIKAEYGDRWFYSKKDFPWQWSHELAESFSSGKANRHDAWTHFENLIKPARAKLTTRRISDYALNGYHSPREIVNFLKRVEIEKNSFAMENIKFNILYKNKMQELMWRDFDALIALTKNLDLLPDDSEKEKLQKMIIAQANITKSWNNAKKIPLEINNLINIVYKKGGTDQSCLGMASKLMK